MTLEQKLLDRGFTYPLANYSVGRLMIVGTLHNELGLDLSFQDLKDVGDLVKKRLKFDFESNLVLNGSQLLGIHRNYMPSSNSKSEIFRNSYEYLSHLTSYKNRFRDKEITQGIDYYKSDPMVQELLSREKTAMFMRQPEKIEGVEYVVFRQKTIQSLVPKFIARLEKLLNPEDDLLSNSRQRTKKGILSSGRSNTPKLNVKLFRKYVIDKLVEIFESGENYYNYVENKGEDIRWIVDKDIVAQEPEVRYKGNRRIGRRGEKVRISGKVKELITDLFLVDGAGMKICVNGDRHLRGIKNLVNNDPRFFVLPQRNEDFYMQGTKDKSIVLGVKGKNESSYGEIRIQTLMENLRGEFGKSAHYQYKRDELRNLARVLQGNIRMLNNAYQNAHFMLPFEIPASGQYVLGAFKDLASIPHYNDDEYEPEYTWIAA